MSVKEKIYLALFGVVGVFAIIYLVSRAKAQNAAAAAQQAAAASATDQQQSQELYDILGATQDSGSSSDLVSPTISGTTVSSANGNTDDTDLSTLLSALTQNYTNSASTQPTLQTVSPIADTSSEWLDSLAGTMTYANTQPGVPQSTAPNPAGIAGVHSVGTPSGLNGGVSTANDGSITGSGIGSGIGKIFSMPILSGVKGVAS